jgi:long-chain acyl-CoA synthetase
MGVTLGIPDFIGDKCNIYSNQTFILTHSGELISYEGFHESMLRIAVAVNPLFPEAGIKFCLALPNTPEFLYLLFAGIKVGGTAVNLNPAMTADEFSFRLEDAGVAIMFTTAEVYERIAHVINEQKIRCIVIEDLSECESNRVEKLNISEVITSGASLQWASVYHDIAFLQYTGGTTGKTKAAMISHDNALSSVRQMAGYLAPRLRNREESFVVTFPFYHVFSIVFQVLMAMEYGGSIILYPYVRDFPLLKKVLKEQNFTVFVGVHTLYKMMLQDDEINTLQFPKAKLFIAGAEHVQPITKKRWLEATGHLIIEGYGLTETSALASMSVLNPEENDIDGIGLPLPGTEFSLVDENGLTITAEDTPGEICIRGPQVVRGYWNRPEENDLTFVDGWLKTGDIGIRKQNGHYKIIDRKKDMINVSGFNVYPNEIEAVLMQYNRITDCAVVAIPDEKSGERVAAFVVSDQPVDNASIISFCREKLSAYKVPVYVEQLDMLPKSPVGKTLRVELRNKVSL